MSGDRETDPAGETPADEVFDDTIPSVRRDDTVVVDRTRPGPRRRMGRPLPQPTVDAAGQTAEGTTVVAHRESRRRARGESAPEPSPAPRFDGRDARQPARGPIDAYPVRPADPVVVPRTPPSPRVPQRPADGLAAEGRVRSRARRRIVGVAVAASAIALAAVVLIIWLAVT